MEVYQETLKDDDPSKIGGSANTKELTMEDYEKMSPIELTQQLIEVAKKGEHRDFEIINNLQEAETALLLAKATKKVVIQFKKMTKNAWKRYCQKTRSCQPALAELIAYQDFCMAREFYQMEYDIIYTDLKEYVSYLFHGHLIDTLLGKERDDFE